MRILHTSDWHLGRTFGGASLLDEQAAVVDRVIDLAVEHQVELVVIAGDLFDRAIPPAPAVELFGEALAQLRATGARVAAISGNHDSAVRVAVGDRLLNEMGVAVRGDVARVAEPLMLTEPADGGPPVAVYLVPFLEPSIDAHRLTGAASVAEPGAPGVPAPASAPPHLPGALAEVVTLRPRRATHDHVTRLATDAIRRHHATLGPARSVVVAHAFVAGGRPSDSERDLSVGGVERVGVDAFDGFDLVALGHLHEAQDLDGPRVGYCGTPLPYSFSEEGQAKSVRIVDLAPDGAVRSESVALGVGRPLRTLTGTLSHLLEHPSLRAHEAARVRARLTDPHLPNQAMGRLRQRFPHAVELRHEPDVARGGPPPAASDLTSLEALSPLDLALRFWADQQGTEASAAEHEVLALAVAATLAEADP